jgi:hypothetical protein
MRRLSDAGVRELVPLLRGPGVALDFGLVRARVRSDCDALAEKLAVVYGAFPLAAADGFCDVTASVVRRGGLRRAWRPQVDLLVDGQTPFEPFPADTDLPLLEWGLNFFIAQRAQHCLLLHAGALERDGAAVILPALPGSGKSTLTAALVSRDWRLLSDEFAAVRLADSRILPVVRPIALKNESIDILRAFAPDAVIGPTFPRTRKGAVAHLAPDAASVADRYLAAAPIAVVFPKFIAGAAVALEPLPRARAFAKLATNSFNYAVLGREGFIAMRRLIGSCACYRLRYGVLADAVESVDALHASLASQPARAVAESAA